jgi:hypothetical protein
MSINRKWYVYIYSIFCNYFEFEYIPEWMYECLCDYMNMYAYVNVCIRMWMCTESQRRGGERDRRLWWRVRSLFCTLYITQIIHNITLHHVSSHHSIWLLAFTSYITPITPYHTVPHHIYGHTMGYCHFHLIQSELFPHSWSSRSFVQCFQKNSKKKTWSN